MVWMWFARKVVTRWLREGDSGQSLVWANSNFEKRKLRNQHPRNMNQMQRGRYSMYEGHLESKERFAIQRYLLIIGKKKNMQVL